MTFLDLFAGIGGSLNEKEISRRTDTGVCPGYR